MMAAIGPIVVKIEMDPMFREFAAVVTGFGRVVDRLTDEQKREADEDIDRVHRSVSRILGHMSTA